MRGKIFTIGHSTRSLEDFLFLLNENKIEELADVRSFPGSKRFPHFNKENLSVSLQENRISYVHIPLLGGRRKPLNDSHNTAWRNDAFRGYADYMETNNFKNGIEQLVLLAKKNNTAFMCSEAVWWRCHRSLIADYLKANGWEVIHILNNGMTQEHPYTSAAKVKNGKLSYAAASLFTQG